MKYRITKKYHGRFFKTLLSNWGIPLEHLMFWCLGRSVGRTYCNRHIHEATIICVKVIFRIGEVASTHYIYTIKMDNHTIFSHVKPFTSCSVIYYQHFTLNNKISTQIRASMPPVSWLRREHFYPPQGTELSLPWPTSLGEQNIMAVGSRFHDFRTRGLKLTSRNNTNARNIFQRSHVIARTHLTTETSFLFDFMILNSNRNDEKKAKTPPQIVPYKCMIFLSTSLL